MGKFPVVFLSLKGVDGLTFDLAYQALCGIIVEEFGLLPATWTICDVTK